MRIMSKDAKIQQDDKYECASQTVKCFRNAEQYASNGLSF